MANCKYCKQSVPKEQRKPFVFGYCSWDCFYGYEQINALRDANMSLPKEYVEPENLPLTPAQEEFCQLYVEYHSDAKAYREAVEYDIDNATANRRGKALRKKPFVKKRVAELYEEHLEIMSNNRLNVVENLVYISNADMREFFDGNGDLKEPTDWTREQGIACKKYTVKYNKEGGISERSIELNDKLRALMSLAKIEEMYKTVTEVKVEHSISSSIETFGDNDMVAKLLESELEEAKTLAYKPKEVIDAEVEDAK